MTLQSFTVSKLFFLQNTICVHNIICNKMGVPNVPITNTIQYINKGLRIMIQIILCLCAALIFFLQNLNYWKMDSTFLKCYLNCHIIITQLSFLLRHKVKIQSTGKEIFDRCIKRCFKWPHHKRNKFGVLLQINK